MSKSKGRKNNYEAMFLISQAAEPSLGKAVEHIKHLLERAEAEVIALAKWDERRLAYEIDKQKRGVYILAYFKCPTDMVGHLERDVQISEQLLRVLITSAEHLTDEEIAANDDRTGLDTEAKLKAEQVDTEQAEGNAKARLGAPAAEERAQTEAAKEQREPKPEARPEAQADAQPEAQPEPKPEAEATGESGGEAEKVQEPGEGETKQD